MHRSLVLAVILATGAARAQAVAPLPEPVAEPAPSFAEPGATPAGAGASHGGLATPERDLAPRSPNKRLLPPTKEPGIWAADEVKASTDGAGASKLAGVPFPAELDGAVNICGRDIESNLSQMLLRDPLNSLNEARKRCTLAHLLVDCMTRRRNAKLPTRYGKPKDRARMQADHEARMKDQYEKDLQKARQFLGPLCTDADWVDFHDIVKKTVTQLDISEEAAK